MPGVTYDFRINFTQTLIEIFVGDTLEISHAGNFTDGSFGFYAQGQPGVAFTLASSALPSINPPTPPDTVDPPDPVDPPDVPVIPLPASALLLLAGLGALGVMRRRT